MSPNNETSRFIRRRLSLAGAFLLAGVIPAGVGAAQEPGKKVATAVAQQPEKKIAAP